MITNHETLPLFGEESGQYIGAQIDRKQLGRSLYLRLKHISLEKFVSCLTNEVKEQIEYARLCAGNRACGKTSLLFNPHRLNTRTKGIKVSIYEALQTESFCDGLARIIRWVDGAENLYQCLEKNINGTQLVNEFQPYVARQLAIDYRLNSESRVLDPCAGWGGRMVGFSTIVNFYAACEPSSETHSGLLQLLEFIRSFRPEFTARLIKLPFEDVTIQPETYDFALTSPPYYDTEEYTTEETNSLNRYSTFEDWCAGFYFPMIEKTMNALKSGCCFILNIGSRKYPLSAKLMEAFSPRYHITKIKSYLSGQGNGLGKKGEGESFYEIKKPL